MVVQTGLPGQDQAPSRMDGWKPGFIRDKSSQTRVSVQGSMRAGGSRHAWPSPLSPHTHCASAAVLWARKLGLTLSKTGSWRAPCVPGSHLFLGTLSRCPQAEPGSSAARGTLRSSAAGVWLGDECSLCSDGTEGTGGAVGPPRGWGRDWSAAGHLDWRRLLVQAHDQGSITLFSSRSICSSFPHVMVVLRLREPLFKM